MKQAKVFAAGEALNNLMNQPWPLKTAYELYSLKKKLAPAMEFQIMEERKILEKLDYKVVGPGQISFANPEMAETYRTSHASLDEFEYPDLDDIQPIVLPDRDGVVITPSDLEKLEGFVTIGGEEK